MSIEQKLKEFSETSSPNDQEFKEQFGVIQQVDNYLNQCEDFEVAKYWYTSPFSRNSEVGLENRFDLIAVLHTDRSERDLAEIFHDCLEEISAGKVINKSVRVKIDGVSINIFPTKFAQQGTIGVDKEDPLSFMSVLGEDEIFQAASRIIQHWQLKSDLNQETQILIASEIEMVLKHLKTEYEPESLTELIQLFYKWSEKHRYNKQLNIFDKHDNILLYHNFIIPEKQEFLEVLFNTTEKLDNEDYQALHLPNL